MDNPELDLNLDESLRLLRTLLESSREGVTITSPGGSSNG